MVDSFVFLFYFRQIAGTRPFLGNRQGHTGRGWVKRTTRRHRQQQITEKSGAEKCQRLHAKIRVGRRVPVDPYTEKHTQTKKKQINSDLFTNWPTQQWLAAGLIPTRYVCFFLLNSFQNVLLAEDWMQRTNPIKWNWGGAGAP